MPRTGTTPKLHADSQVRQTFRMIGTEADLNDHWVELILSDSPPELDQWQKITCVDFHSENGAVHLMSVMDNQPPISATVKPGKYAAYFAAQNLGVDQLIPSPTDHDRCAHSRCPIDMIFQG